MSDIFFKTPLLEALPSACSGVLEGTFDTAVGTVCIGSDVGTQQVHQGLVKISMAATTLLLSLININPYRKTVPLDEEHELSLTRRVEDYFDGAIANSEYGIVKRLYIVAAMPSLVLTHCVDLIAGVNAFIAAFLVMGMSETLNYRAFAHLSVGLEVIKDLPVGVAKLLHPDATPFNANSAAFNDHFDYYTNTHPPSLIVEPKLEA